MSNCSDPVTCLNGNCIGCRDGQVWCQDPRCSPYCPGSTCIIPKGHDVNANIIIILIIVALFAMLFIIWFMYGPQLIESHSNHARANVIVPST